MYTYIHIEMGYGGIHMDGIWQDANHKYGGIHIEMWGAGYFTVSLTHFSLHTNTQTHTHTHTEVYQRVGSRTL